METSREHWHELWGTCSVKDHQRPGAFVAEVLLYDKILIPVPPTVEDGLSADEAASEWDRWSKAWSPDRQQRILEILGDRAEPIPWTADRQTEWQKNMNEQFSDARRNGYFVTGTVLQRFAPAMARSVVTVSQYHSVAELNKGAKIRRVQPQDKLPGSSLMAVLGYELLLPDEPEEDDDFSMLREAVQVAVAPTFRAKRRSLYDWQQDFLTPEGVTDATSIKSAVTQMQRLVDEMKTATERQKRWKWSKKFFSFMGAASKGAALLIPPVAAVASATDAVISLGKFVTQEGAEANRFDRTSNPAASLILDLREKLGIEGK